MQQFVNLPTLETLQNASGHTTAVSQVSIFNDQERIDKIRNLYGQFGSNELFDMLHTKQLQGYIKEEIEEWRETLSTTPALSDTQKAELLDFGQLLEKIKDDEDGDFDDIPVAEIKKDDDSGEIIDVEFS